MPILDAIQVEYIFNFFFEVNVLQQTFPIPLTRTHFFKMS